MILPIFSLYNSLNIPIPSTISQECLKEGFSSDDKLNFIKWYFFIGKATVLVSGSKIKATASVTTGSSRPRVVSESSPSCSFLFPAQHIAHAQDSVLREHEHTVQHFRTKLSHSLVTVPLTLQ